MKHRTSGNKHSFGHRVADSASRDTRQIRLQTMARVASARAQRLSLAKSLIASNTTKPAMMPAIAHEQRQATAVNAWEDEGGALRHPADGEKRIGLKHKK